MLNEMSLLYYLITKFLTSGDNGANYVSDKYSLKLGDKIRFFFKEGACLVLSPNTLPIC
jgi:phytanoyl-CoA hydroxylase